MTTLNLSQLVDVNLYVSPLSAPRKSFDRALIVGNSGVIDTVERVKGYTSPDDMLTDGFALTDKEYLAAVAYFSQNPAPEYLYVGAQGISPPETPLQAITACRAKNAEWYVGICLEATDEDHLLIAQWCESALPFSVYGYQSSDPVIITSASSDVMSTLKGLSYKRSIGQYSTQQNAIASIMGFAMGANNGLNNSAFTLMFKGEVGIAVEDITQTQADYIDGKNGNVYVNYGNYYNIFQKGKMANGYFFDEVLNLDMLYQDIQLNLMDILYSTNKVPQTDAGQLQLISAVNQACDAAVSRGFLAPGEWKGPHILNLYYGDTLPNGYLVQSEPYSRQSVADRQARKSMPIYIAVKLAGAVHEIVIGVYVNR